jgi:hypothetical protein
MTLRKLLVGGILAFTNMAVWAEDGSTFTAKTSENITMTFQVISEADKTCRVGNNYKECISRTTTKAVTVPAVAKDYKVVEIGNNAFQWCYNIPSVTLPEGITSIGSSAFSPCTGLKSINIPSTVVTIKERAFFNCSGLTSITLPPSVKTIGYSAFCGCSKMETVTLSEGLEEIGNEAFNYCQTLSTLVIPASVQTIGLNIVNNCSKIASLGVAQGNTVYDCEFTWYINSETQEIILSFNDNRVMTISDFTLDMIENEYANHFQGIMKNSTETCSFNLYRKGYYNANTNKFFSNKE